MRQPHWRIDDLVDLVRGSSAVGRDLQAQSVPLPAELTAVTDPEPDHWVAQVGQEHASDYGRTVANWRRAITEPGVIQTIRAKRRLGDQWFEVEIHALSLLHQPEFGFVLSYARMGAAIDEPNPDPVQDSATYGASHSFVQYLDPVGIILRTDGDVEQVFHRTVDELVGQPITDFLHPDDLDAAVGMWIEVHSSADNGRTIQQRIVRPDGSHLWVQSLVLNHADADGAIMAVSHDISTQRGQQAALEASEQELRFLTESVPLAVFRSSGSGHITFANARWEAILGPVASIGGVLEVLVEADRALLEKACSEAKSVRRTATVRVRHLDDRHLEFRLQGVGGAGDVDDDVGIIGTVDDVTSEVHRTSQLEATAERDHLTGLANRRGLISALSTTDPGGGSPLVLFGDLDGFKDVNDAWGHGVGDRLLTIVGQRLRGAVRPGDLVGRWGGDEFVVLCRERGRG